MRDLTSVGITDLPQLVRLDASGRLLYRDGEQGRSRVAALLRRLAGSDGAADLWRIVVQRRMLLKKVDMLELESSPRAAARFRFVVDDTPFLGIVAELAPRRTWGLEMLAVLDQSRAIRHFDVLYASSDYASHAVDLSPLRELVGLDLEGARNHVAAMLRRQSEYEAIPWQLASSFVELLDKESRAK